LAALLDRAHEGYAPLLADAELARFVRPRECLYLYSNAASFDAARPALDLRRQLGVAFDVLGGNDIRALEPSLAPIFERGVLFSNSWHFSNPQGFLQTLYLQLADQGLTLQRSSVDAVQPSADGASVTIEGATRRFSHVVIATGARSAQFAKQCGDPVPLDTERGYHVR
ncbi:MAG: NAD(P)/FAD-dependent oxidoreductase, partial [Paraburkholderia nemoris]